MRDTGIQVWDVTMAVLPQTTTSPVQIMYGYLCVRVSFTYVIGVGTLGGLIISNTFL